MELIFLGTGPSTPVESAKDGRTRSSLAVKTDKLTFLIDCSLDFLEQVKREKIENINFIAFTHAHRDAMGGISDLKKWMKERDINTMPVFCEETVMNKIRERLDTSHLDFHLFKPYHPFATKEFGIQIVPFRLIHSIQPGFPAVGFRFGGIVYSEDVGEIPKESEKYYHNAKIIVFDAAMWFDRFIKGHYNVESALELAKKFNPDTFVLTQAGHTYPKQEVAEQEIEKYWQKTKEKSKTNIILAKDGLTMTIKKAISQTLSENKAGIYLVEPHGRLIWEKSKTMIVKSKEYSAKIGQLLYLLSGDLAYGIIRLKKPIKIDILEFKKLYSEHKISEEERKKWWVGKKILFAYRFDVIKFFEKPKKVKLPVGVQTFVDDFEFINEENKKELIHDISSYNPDKANNQQLADDWRIVNAWYSTKKSGGKIRFSIEAIINLAGIIYREIKKRVIEGKMRHKFQPEKMTEHSKELYNIVSKSKTGIMHTLINQYITATEKELAELLERFGNQEIKIIHNFVSLVGSQVKREKEHKPNDVDLHVRFGSNIADYLQRAIKVRFDKLLDDDTAEKLHWIFGDAEGSHDSFVPLYHLALIPADRKMVEMQDTISVFSPMKPAKRFYQVDEIIDYMFEKSGKFGIEKKFNGFRAIIIKRGSNIKIFSDQKKDITFPFPTAENEAKKLTERNFIIDCELVLYENQIPKGRSEIAKYIGAVKSHKDIDDSGIIFHVFDCIYHDNESLNELPWYERKKILHSFDFTNHIKEVPSIIVSTKEEAKKAINLTKNLKGSEGAIIKRYDGKYFPGKESDAWIKFRNEDTIIVRVMKVTSKEVGKTYLMGIKPPENANEKYVENGYLILGNTFVTKIEATKGDNIAVNIEETWRHTYSKSDTIRYSIHKPRVMEKTNKSLTTWKELDELAVSKGEEVIENVELADSDKFEVGQKIRIGPFLDHTYHEGIIIDVGTSEDQKYRVKVKDLVINKEEWIDKDNINPISRENDEDWKLESTTTMEGETTTATPGIASIQGKVWRYEPKKKKKDILPVGKVKTSQFDEESVELAQIEDEPREDIAKKFWEENWHKMYPKDGKGKFIYHHHWRGLTEEEAKELSDKQLLDTNHSIHGDLRGEVDSEILWGFTVFTGSAEDNKKVGGDKLIYESENKRSPTKLQGSWKLEIPHGWLTTGVSKPTLSPPRGVGATIGKWAKFFAIDTGTYEMGVWREHSVEIFLDGKKLKGRAIIQYAPVGEGGRKWLIDFPDSQESYADTHNKEEIIKELKQKNQKYLIWAKPGEKPEKIEIKE